jgi:hypothetical protein
MATGVRDIDALAKRGIQQGLALFDLNGRTQRFNQQLVTHGLLCWLRVQMALTQQAGEPPAC